MKTIKGLSHSLLALAMLGAAACGQPGEDITSPSPADDAQRLDNPVAIAIFPVGELAPTGDLLVNGVACDAFPCRALVEQGDEVILELEVGPGSAFRHWYGIEGCAKRSICQFTATDDLFVDVEVAPASSDARAPRAGHLVHGALGR